MAVEGSMSVITATFRRKPVAARERTNPEPQQPERACHSLITWGNLATLVVGCTIVGTALFLGSRGGSAP
jgi:hypothetical protein